jgi:hypothetical protein
MCNRNMKIYMSFLIFLCCTSISIAQDSIDTSPEITQKPGFQLGYAYSGLSKVEAGANYYWTIEQCTNRKKGEFVYHTFGPSAGLTVLFLPDRTLTGMQAGVNYHFYLPVCPRMSINYENYFNGDQRIGAELGASALGFFAYAGYYQPVGNRETKGLTAFRVGIRFVFNMVLIEAAPPE